MADYILADCVVCNRETDAIDGDEAPVCVECSDQGLTGEYAITVLGRIQEIKAMRDQVKRRRAMGESVASIAASMGVGRRTVYYWLRK